MTPPYEPNEILGLIRYAGLVGISARIVRAHRATGSLANKDDLINASATLVDELPFRHGNIVWGHVVEDIVAFCREVDCAIEGGASA